MEIPFGLRRLAVFVRGPSRTARAVVASLGLALAIVAPAHAEPREHLIVVRESGIVPLTVFVRPGDRIVWLNRTVTGMIAVRLESASAAPRECADERGFRRLSGLPPFTSLLPPGTVAVTCAPVTEGAHRYDLSGDVVGHGWIEVRGGDGR